MSKEKCKWKVLRNKFNDPDKAWWEVDCSWLLFISWSIKDLKNRDKCPLCDKKIKVMEESV